MKKKIPVHIITGFLGSGKTTFLNHFLKSKTNERIVVIENEIGKINIDGADSWLYLLFFK
jgi:G3E family GTPase